MKKQRERGVGRCLSASLCLCLRKRERYGDNKMGNEKRILCLREEAKKNNSNNNKKKKKNPPPTGHNTSVSLSVSVSVSEKHKIGKILLFRSAKMPNYRI